MNHLTIEEVFDFGEENVEKTINEIKDTLNLSSEKEIRQALFNRPSDEFNRHIQ